MGGRSRHAVARRAVAGWARNYPLAPRYPPDQRLRLRTADGVRLGGAFLPGPPGAPAAVVLVHGFAHSSRTPRIRAFATFLATRFPVVLPDLRGHGASGGTCTFGAREPLDVAAAVAAAPPGLPVVTVGVSLGAAAALLHAGARRRPDGPAPPPASGPAVGRGVVVGGWREVAGVVAVSAPAWWAPAEAPGTSRLAFWTGSRSGRAVLANLVRTRVAAARPAVPDAADAVAAVAPAFTLLVHDPADWYFGHVHAERLFAWAGEPKALWWRPGGGHGSDLLTSELAAQVADHVEERLAPG